MKTNQELIRQVIATLEAECVIPTSRDACRSALTAAKELQERLDGDGWLPIESAPKGGEWIVVAGGKNIDDGDEHEIAIVQWADFVTGHGREMGWVIAYYDGGYPLFYQNPTHWRPLFNTPTKENP